MCNRMFGADESDNKQKCNPLSDITMLIKWHLIWCDGKAEYGRGIFISNGWICTYMTKDAGSLWHLCTLWIKMRCRRNCFVSSFLNAQLTFRFSKYPTFFSEKIIYTGENVFFLMLGYTRPMAGFKCLTDVALHVMWTCRKWYIGNHLLPNKWRNFEIWWPRLCKLFIL